jgi:OPA family glycerol-3-phosphate transporter-like MFS transporter
MGYLALDGWHDGEARTFAFAYAANMYFQSFGAVSIVKVNASWFHLRERGTFGGIFGILISLGLAPKTCNGGLMDNVAACECNGGWM